MRSYAPDHPAIRSSGNSIISRRGFTLVELLVVIGILGILIGVILSTFGKSTEAARAAKCLLNLRSLANAATAYSMEKGQWYYDSGNIEGELGYYPMAGSVCGGKRGDFQEFVGWISWLSEGVYKSSGISQPVFGDSVPNCPYYGTQDPKRDNWALEHGALWRAIGQTREPYVCPTHLKKSKHKKLLFSYVMSMYFGYDKFNGKDYVQTTKDHIKEEGKRNGSIHRADRVLMFAEIEGKQNGKESDDESAGKCPPECDCVLQYKATVNGQNYGAEWKGNPESIAFHHLGASGKEVGHVAFADGHVEKFVKPSGGSLDKYQLTAALCEGLDIGNTGSKYQVIESSGETY